MDQLGLEQVFFLPNSVSCCPLGAALRDPTMCCGKVLISHRPQGRHAPNIHPCFWGGLKLLLPVRILVFRAEFPLEAIIPGKNTDTPLPGLYVSIWSLPHKNSGSVFPGSARKKSNSRFLRPVSLVCTSQMTCLLLIRALL